MNALNITLQDQQTHYTPGSLLQGTVRWQLPKTPSKLSLQLLWFTSGKGSSDIQIVGSQDFRPGAASGSEPFRFQLPDGPFSFSGKLISLTWTLELLSEPGEGNVRSDFFLSPTGREIILPSIPQPAGKSFGPLKLG